MLGRISIALIILLLIGCSSQPRFVHHGGDPEQMFDNKTAQDCWAGPVQKDDGIAAMDESSKELETARQKSENTNAEDGDACYRALDRYPNGINASGERPVECHSMDIASNLVMTELKINLANIDRVARLREHLDERRVIYVHGLPYCSDLK